MPECDYQERRSVPGIYLHHEGLSIPRKEEKEGEKRGVGRSETLKR